MNLGLCIINRQVTPIFSFGQNKKYRCLLVCRPDFFLVNYIFGAPGVDMGLRQHDFMVSGRLGVCTVVSLLMILATIIIEYLPELVFGVYESVNPALLKAVTLSFQDHRTRIWGCIC